MSKALEFLKTRGATGLVDAVGRRILGSAIKCFATAKPLIAGKAGLEIGGPSDVFAAHSILPAYAIAGALDNVNFSRATVWEGAIAEGDTFVYNARRSPGRQFILEATGLAPIPDERYAFVLSSHTIEHSANPLRALREWVRVLEPGGALVLIVPHKEGTFDHRRPLTRLEHLIGDDRNATREDDGTHLAEILACHDLALDPPAGNFADFKARSERNAENRCLHHHVFDTRLALQMVDAAGMQVLAVEPVRPYHIVVIAQKPGASRAPDNAAVLSDAAEYRRTSPFGLDRE
jgi:SAM-dependent methyltransferase